MTTPTADQVSIWKTRAKFGETWAVSKLAEIGLDSQGKTIGDPLPTTAPVADMTTVGTSKASPAVVAAPEYSTDAKARNEVSYAPRKRALINAADAYDKLGYAPIKLKPRSKEGPKGWPDQHLTGETAPQFFDADDNIGCLLGPKSGGRIDLDLDWPEAARAADILFDGLPAFGRAGKLRSHRLTINSGAKSLKLKLPEKLKDDLRFQGEHGLVICEVRASGQTVFPPSIHPTGELVEWHGGPPSDIPVIEIGSMQRRIAAVAVTALAMRCNPGEGSRNDTLLAFNGALLRILGGEAALVDRLAALVAGAWHYSETRPQAAPTWAKLEAGEECVGLPTLLERVGLPADLARTIKSEWLGDEDDACVTIRTFDINGTLDDLDTGAVATGVPVYRRGPQLVHAFRLDKTETDDLGVIRRQGALGIHDVGPTRLSLYFDEYLTFWRRDKDGDLVQEPLARFAFLAPFYTARIDRCRLPVLEGIVECPTLRADGTLLTTQGYDAASRLLLDSGDLVVPTIPEAPSKDQASAALTILNGLLDEFPFKPDLEDDAVPSLNVRSKARSVAVSAILTALVRRVISRAPLHGFDAADVANGKSTLCHLVAIIGTGRETTTITLPSDEEEAVKVWLSILMRGDQVVTIDNVDRDKQVGGGVLAKIITEPRFSERLLGTNTHPDVPTNVTVLANGNNLTFTNDLVSRAIKCRLDCGQERAQDRKFKCDILAHAKARRGELVAAALTVLRAYVVAGRPLPSEFTPSRFPDWDKLVRGALLWLGEPDPYETAIDVAAVDPEREALARLHVAFAQCFGTEEKRSKEIAERIGGQPDDAGAELRAAIDQFSDGNFGKRTVTAILRAHDGQIVNGRRFRIRRDVKEVVHVRLETMKGTGRIARGNEQQNLPL